MPVSSFAFGTNTLVAIAVDQADNLASRTVTLMMQAQAPLLCDLGRSFFGSSRPAEALCSMLGRIKDARDAGNTRKRDGLVEAYANAVSAHAGHLITEDQAQTLIRWVRDWAVS